MDSKLAQALLADLSRTTVAWQKARQRAQASIAATRGIVLLLPEGHEAIQELLGVYEQLNDLRAWFAARESEAQETLERTANSIGQPVPTISPRLH